MNGKLFFKNILQIVCIIVINCSFLQAQDIPFDCEYNAYLFQYNDVYAVDLASGSSYLVQENVTPGSINAAAYNPADGFIWGSLSSPSKTIVRIGKNFNTLEFYVDELPTANRYVGDVSASGVYHLKGGGTSYYKIDLDPDSDNYGGFITSSQLSQNINIHDWAFNAVDGMLYTVEKGSNNLYRINGDTGAVESLGEVPILSGLNYTYGAVYFDASGRFYVSANQTGTIYVIQSVQDIIPGGAMYSNLFAFGPSSSQNDGARCPTAPVPQEICDNGIDDDGDGLIDCEDPSCSGYGDCEVIDPETETANEGGLESNNRLGNAINNRNYNRAKSGFAFDRNAAPMVTKKDTYGQRSASISLEDLIPLEVIDEDEVIDSTPTDLLGITNATEVYGVDYIRNENAVASILLLKTENGVYEHTKYICDRLLGAELLSVSTMDINEHQFIKALIKNIDGTIEFVLSLSAKVSADASSFAIDSHWNLDSYENDVTYYNFQIWANSVDDLYELGKEALNLVEIQKPIEGYNLSQPPTVFVNKGSYFNGELDLVITNVNQTQAINFDAGLRDTETSETEYVSTSLDLNGEYISYQEIQLGSLFDIGFRVGDGIHVADDLFLSDGPWGIDDSETNTSIISYEVMPNEISFEANEFPVERNVQLEATTDTYVGVYRALTPRFQPVDMTAYNSLKFNASGTGNLEVTFVRKSIANWEDQYRSTISLTGNTEEYMIAISEAQLQDLVTLVFTMSSSDGSLQTKTVSLEEMRFTTEETLGLDETATADIMILKNYPNPFSEQTTIQFPTVVTQGTITVVDMLGRVVDEQELSINEGTTASYTASQLPTGIYSYTIVADKKDIYAGKFMIR